MHSSPTAIRNQDMEDTQCPSFFQGFPGSIIGSAKTWILLVLVFEMYAWAKTKLKNCDT